MVTVQKQKERKEGPCAPLRFRTGKRRCLRAAYQVPLGDIGVVLAALSVARQVPLGDPPATFVSSDPLRLRGAGKVEAATERRANNEEICLNTTGLLGRVTVQNRTNTCIPAAPSSAVHCQFLQGVS
jgi:hypothetical protein